MRHGQSVVLFGLHRGGSSISARLLELVLRAAGYGATSDEGRRYYDAGYDLDQIPRSFYDSLVPDKHFYGPFRAYNSIMRLSNFSNLTKIMVVRDPRDCLVSSYFSLREAHDRLDVRRVTQRLPTPLDESETIDEFCIRSSLVFRSYIDSLKLLCLDYPETLQFRYENIYSDPSGWLDLVISMLSLEIPAESRDQARLEAVFKAANEDPSRHHRQGRPGDYQRKLARSTIMYLTNIFEPQLSFFGYGSTSFSDPSAARCVPSRALCLGLQDDIAALKRVIVELQIENGFRINEIASMRSEIELLKVGRQGPADLNRVESPSE